MEKYDHKIIEKKWQEYWDKHPELFYAQDKSNKEKKYILDMFPYPSGEGLHVGHVESYTATDIISRYLRMNGKNVLHPQGWDAFGLPAENYAIKTKVHPLETTKKAIETFKGQMNRMGFSYDWSREVCSADPDYYKWTQWFFLLLYKNGLAYKKKASVNWCDSCQTVLANEQAEGGICERCKHEVIQKDLEQWFFKITNFIEPSFVKTSDGQRITAGLIDGLNNIDWPGSTKAGQLNWIGKSEGAQFKLPVILNEAKRNEESRNITGSFASAQDDKNFIEVYTTRVDTVFGMTYAIVAPEHEIIEKLKDRIKNYSEVEKYIAAARKKTELERTELQKEKTGVRLEGVEVVNPFTNKEIPLFVSDYVIGSYGTGAIMAVPAHDERDWEFAKKNNLPIENVIEPCFYQSIEPGKVKEGEPFEDRESITAIVKHWKDDTYLGLKWKQVAWQTVITGGIEKGQTAEEAARFEVTEETGYKNLKLVRELPPVHAKFYHVPKKVNRFAHSRVFYFELEDGERDEMSEAENSIHDVVWIPKDEMEKFMTPESQRYLWLVLHGQGGAYTEDGVLANSGEYTRMSSEEARKKMTEWLEKNKLGNKKINYKLRDWLVSRQRYWGAPIPIIYCDKCGEVPVPEKDLPVLLPDDVDFVPTGESPLQKSKKFHDVKCPKCGGKARRESDTMDTFVCSSWYYFRYSDPKNEKEFASSELIKKWLPVDLYVGGAEHTVLHLLYSRFFTKVLHKLGYIDFDEPFLKLRHQGIILAEDGNKMSKSLGNVINPDQVVEEFGADALRMFEMFMGPLDSTKPWNTKGIVGISRFLEKVWKLQSAISSQQPADSKIKILLHKTISKVTKDIENFRFNTAISQMMTLVNEMEKQEFLLITDYCLLLTVLSPFAPHIAEELWHRMQTNTDLTQTNAEKIDSSYKSIFLQTWPMADEKYLKDEKVEMVVQVNGKLRDRISVSPEITEDEAKKVALESEKIKVILQGKEIKKIIFVKGKLLSIVI